MQGGSRTHHRGSQGHERQFRVLAPTTRLADPNEANIHYCTTNRSSNGGTEAVNGLIELHRRVAGGFRNFDNYRLRMLLIGGGLTDPEHLSPPQV